MVNDLEHVWILVVGGIQPRHICWAKKFHYSLVYMVKFINL